jgi:three-Cys-motif partner protein
VTDPYSDREQTRAKHFILKHYLQALAFKVLRFSDVTYVDGFSGPWETKTEDFSDSSFMIAISVLKDAQKKILENTGAKRRIRCFFSESNPDAFKELERVVAQFRQTDDGFEIKTYLGQFEDAVSLRPGEKKRRTIRSSRYVY